MARAAATALFTFFLATAAQAAPPSCGPRDVVVDYLARAFQEMPAGAGTANAGGRVELFAAPGGRSWTLLYTGPDGRSCMIAAGRGWTTPPSTDDNTPKPR